MNAPEQYVIRLSGHLPAGWTDEFPGMTINETAKGITILHGYVPDQSALHGLLNRIRDLNVTLISVERLKPGSAEAFDPDNVED